MFTPARRYILYTAGLLVVLANPVLFGQEISQDPGKLQQSSLTSFKQREYREAFSGYRLLMESDQGNALYAYYAGICLVEMNEQLDEAIEYLYSASKNSVPFDVNFYLGKAYHQNYNFKDALSYYQRFELRASRQEIREYNVKQLISTCRSAREITATYNPYEVMNVTFIDLLDSAQFSQIRMKGGQLQRKPSVYYTAEEDREDLNSLMFMPASVVRGDYIYYSGYTRSGKGGAQLFRVKKGAARTWSDPEEIRELNSEGDEIMPYFDPIEDDLYYASNGRDGIGGFDLYRSHYDSQRDVWSEPINLGFPINSVMDEYLLLPGSDLGMVMFFTTRQGTDSTVTVYRVHLVEPKKKTIPNDYRMLNEIAYLGGVADEILADIESLSESERRPVSTEQHVVPGKAPERPDATAITPVRIVSESSEKSAYQLALGDALMHQSVSDSLKDLATAARVRVRESDDPNDRWVWQKQIMVWEKKARDEEEKADAMYAQLKDNQASNKRAKPAVNVPETIQVDKVLDDLTVYSYTDPVRTVEGEPGTPPVPKETEIESSAHINRFDILAGSPYSAENPIPMDVALPGGAFYRIQMGAFGKQVEPGAFYGISPITGERIADRGLFKYYAGKFSKYDDASIALSKIRSTGYEDAFIVAWYNGTSVSTQRAKQLE